MFDGVLFDVRFDVLMIMFRYLIISNLFVNNFICLYFNYMLIMFLLFRIADSIMKFVLPPILRISVIWMIPLYLETNRYWKYCFTGAVSLFMSSIPCDGWNSCVFAEKTTCSTCRFYLALARDRNLDY